jgi:hypothetical protein
MPFDGADVWPGNFASPIDYYMRRRRRLGMPPYWRNDPIRGMEQALAEWAGEPLSNRRKGLKRMVRQDRIVGLLALQRPLTPAEEAELDHLIDKHVKANRNRRKRLARTTDKGTRRTK